MVASMYNTEQSVLAVGLFSVVPSSCQQGCSSLLLHCLVSSRAKGLTFEAALLEKPLANGGDNSSLRRYVVAAANNSTYKTWI